MIAKLVFEWYLSIIASFCGLILSIILTIIIVQKTNSEHVSLKVSLYGVYVSAIMCFITFSGIYILLPISKQIDPSLNQKAICNVIYTLAMIATGFYQLSLINFFIVRLDIAFKNTLYQLSKCTNYAFRITWTVIWTFVLLLIAVSVDSSPLNIYTKEVDYTGNGVTCSAISGTKQSNMFKLGVYLVGLSVFGGNICTLIVFLHKLRSLIKAINQSGKLIETQDLVQLMKKQTFIVGLASVSTIVLWIMTGTGVVGGVPGQIDFFVNIFVIFISFKTNIYWYVLCKCDIITIKCCTCFGGMSADIQLAGIHKNEVKGQDTSTSKPKTNESSNQISSV